MTRFRSRILTIALFALMGTVAALLIASVVHSARFSGTFSECESLESADMRNNCRLEVLDNDIGYADTEEFFNAVEYLVEHSAEFENQLCNRGAYEKAGAAAYKNHAQEDSIALNSALIPHEAAACSGAYLRGFVEQMARERPSAIAIASACESLRGSVDTYIPHAVPTCYRASGMGFARAAGDSAASERMSLTNLLKEPLEECERLTERSLQHIEVCQEGVFNIGAAWLHLGSFGLLFDPAAPFRVCNRFDSLLQSPCISQMAMYAQATSDAVDAYALTKDITSKTLRKEAFAILMVGLGNSTDAETILRSCTRLVDGDLHRICIENLLTGILEKDAGRSKYARALAQYCAAEYLTDSGGTEHCYAAVAQHVARNYVEEEKASLCAIIPAPYGEYCELAR